MNYKNGRVSDLEVCKIVMTMEMFCLSKSLAVVTFKIISPMQLGCFYVESDTKTIFIFVLNEGL